MEEKLSIYIRIAIAILSFAIIAFQVNLIQIFAYIQWYHFAYMAISIALLGFGIAGSILTIYKKVLVDNYGMVFPLLCFITAILMSVLMALNGSEILHLELFHFQFSILSFTQLLCFYLLLTLPFITGALAIGLSFVCNANEIGNLYFYDLFGSGIGALMITFMAEIIFPHKLGIYIAMLPFLCGVLSFNLKRKVVLYPFAIVTFLVLAGTFIFAPFPTTSDYKPLSKALLLPDAKKELIISNSDGIIEIVSSPVLRHAPGLSLVYPHAVPSVDGVFLNGEWLGALDQNLNDSFPDIYDFTNFALPFRLNQVNSMLVVGDPLGSISKYAYKKDIPDITLLAPDKVLKSIKRNNHPSFLNDTDFEDKINIREAYLKSFLLKNPKSYDLITFPYIGQMGSAGMNAIKENHSLTSQNLTLAWNRLNDNGVLAMHSWLEAPAKASLKLFVMLIECLKENGIEHPLRHIISIKTWNTISYFISKSQWDLHQYELADQFCSDMQFDGFINNGKILQSQDFLHNSDDTLFTQTITCLAEGNRACLNQSDFDLQSPNDNKPFFNKYLNIFNLNSLFKKYGSQLFYLEIGYLFLWITFLLLLFLATLFIILPILRIGFSGNNRNFTFFYFAAIGIGYIFIEISYLHRIIPYLGNPLYAFSTTLSALLISSGLGSLMSQYSANNISGLKFIAPLLMLILLIINLFFFEIFNTIAKAGNLATFYTYLLICLPGLLMGWFFPLGIRQLHASRTDIMIPWAWAINGFFSVLAAVSAMIIASEIGFHWVSYLAILAYLIALLSAIFALRIKSAQ